MRHSADQGGAPDSEGLVQPGGVDERVRREVDESDHYEGVVQGLRAERAEAAEPTDKRELDWQPADDEARGDGQHRLDDVLPQVLGASCKNYRDCTRSRRLLRTFKLYYNYSARVF